MSITFLRFKTKIMGTKDDPDWSDSYDSFNCHNSGRSVLYSLPFRLQWATRGIMMTTRVTKGVKLVFRISLFTLLSEGESRTLLGHSWDSSRYVLGREEKMLTRFEISSDNSLSPSCEVGHKISQNSLDKSFIRSLKLVALLDKRDQKKRWNSLIRSSFVLHKFFTRSSKLGYAHCVSIVSHNDQQ